MGGGENREFMLAGTAPTSIAASPAVAAGEGLSRVRCFLLGAELGDALEDLQEQTEDLVEQAAKITQGSGDVFPDTCLTNTWSDVRDILLGPAVLDCGFDNPEVQNLVQNLNPLLTGRRTDMGSMPIIKPEDVPVIRLAVDNLTAIMAHLENSHE